MGIENIRGINKALEHHSENNKEYWSGNSWCENCKQVVDVYSKDNKIFNCGFCGKIIERR